MQNSFKNLCLSSVWANRLWFWSLACSCYWYDTRTQHLVSPKKAPFPNSFLLRRQWRTEVTDYLTDWLSSWLTELLSDWLIDRLTVLPYTYHDNPWLNNWVDVLMAWYYLLNLFSDAKPFDKSNKINGGPSSFSLRVGNSCVLVTILNRDSLQLASIMPSLSSLSILRTPELLCSLIGMISQP